MKLPNGQRADIGTKLEDYSLNPLHRHGQHKALLSETTNGEIQMHDVVVLLEDTPASHFETRPIILRRGQVGTVVMIYEGSAFEMEFAGRDGRAYAMLPVKANRLMVLRNTPEWATASS